MVGQHWVVSQHPPAPPQPGPGPRTSSWPSLCFWAHSGGKGAQRVVSDFPWVLGSP